MLSILVRGEQVNRETLIEKNRKRSILVQRLLWWSLGIALVPLLMALIVGYRYTTLVLQRAATEAVSSLADVKSEQFQNYASERRADVHGLGHLRRVAVALDVLPREHQGGPEHSPGYLAAEHDLRTYFDEVATSYAYDGAFLVSPEGDELFSLRQRGTLGTNYRTGPYCETALAQGFEVALATRASCLTRFAPFERSGSPAAFIAAPVLLEGAVNGVLILQFGTESLLKITSNHSGLCQT